MVVFVKYLSLSDKTENLMNSIAFEAKKAEAAKLILLENDEEVVDKLMTYFKRIKKSSTHIPCQFTNEELKAEVEKGILQHKNGQTKSQEEVFDYIEKLLAD